ncbi:MAG TPA: hypothetical protein VM103_00385 [Candidatus Paceibacterota bacterium]|nr:hypothetical protein [Candidatus Paceibacterota bacterium]
MKAWFALFGSLLFLYAGNSDAAEARCVLPKTTTRVVLVRPDPSQEQYCHTLDAAREVARAYDRDGETFDRLKQKGVCGELAEPKLFYTIMPHGERVSSREPKEGFRWIYALCEAKPETDGTLPLYFISMNPGF